MPVPTALLHRPPSSPASSSMTPALSAFPRTPSETLTPIILCPLPSLTLFSLSFPSLLRLFSLGLQSNFRCVHPQPPTLSVPKGHSPGTALGLPDTSQGTAHGSAHLPGPSSVSLSAQCKLACPTVNGGSMLSFSQVKTLGVVLDSSLSHLQPDQHLIRKHTWNLAPLQVSRDPLASCHPGSCITVSRLHPPSPSAHFPH